MPVKKGTRKKGGNLPVGYLASSAPEKGSEVEAVHAVTPESLKEIQSGTEVKQDGGKKKRKAGPYALFVKKNYAKVAKEHPSWKATDCIK
jgi:hypothetical protein